MDKVPLKMSVQIVLTLAMAHLPLLNSQESAKYLESAIRDLKSMNSFQAAKRSDALSYSELKSQMQNIAPIEATDRAHQPEPLTSHNAIHLPIHHSPVTAPPLTLTKGELAAIYEAAVNKGKTVKLDPGTGNYIHAAVHELDSSPYSEAQDAHYQQSDELADSSGYYYYYYPLKSFLDDHAGDAHHTDDESHHYTTSHPQPQYHSHTHQHNVHITPVKTGMEGEKKKALEPLFMAISGFIGMAVMFVLSAVVLPKFGVLKSRGGKQQFNPELSSLARVALLAIEGKGCSERIACEIGKTANAFNLYDNRFVKLIRRMSPMSFRRQIDRVGKYTDKKLKCATIQCNRKNKPLPKPKPTKKIIK